MCATQKGNLPFYYLSRTPAAFPLTHAYQDYQDRRFLPKPGRPAMTERRKPDQVEKLARRRAAAAKRLAKHRALEADGWACSWVDYHCDLINAMVRWGWLPNKETHAKAEIRRALSEMLAEAAASDSLQK